MNVFFRASEMCFGQRRPGGGGCLPALWGARGFSFPWVPTGTWGPAGAQLEPLFGGVWRGLKRHHVSQRFAFYVWLVAPFASAFALSFLFQAPSPLKLLQGCYRNHCTPVPGEEQGAFLAAPSCCCCSEGCSGQAWERGGRGGEQAATVVSNSPSHTIN